MGDLRPRELRRPRPFGDHAKGDPRIVDRRKRHDQTVEPFLPHARRSGLHRHGDALDRRAAARAMRRLRHGLHRRDHLLRRSRAGDPRLPLRRRRLDHLAEDRSALADEARGGQLAAIGHHRCQHRQMNRVDLLVLQADRQEAGLEVVEHLAFNAA